VCVDLALPQHCGTCGNVCQADTYCCSGSCLPVGLLAYYKFDEAVGSTFADSSCNGHDGTHNATWAPGKKGSALSFDGSTMATVPSSPALVYGQNNADFTVEYWIYDGQGPTWSWRNVFHHGNIDAERTSAQWLSPSVEQLVAVISTTTNSNDYISTGTLLCDTWVHFADVKSGNTHSIYVNGILITVESLQGSSVSSPAPIYLGKNPWYPGIGGLLDEVRIYTRALSQAEILADMQ